MFFKIIKEDCKAYKIKLSLISILKNYFVSSSFKAVVIFRISQYFYSKNLKFFAVIFKQKNIKRNSCEIGFQARIGNGMVIRHPMGIVISGDCQIGSNVIISQNVTIGNKNGESCCIGDNCDIGSWAIILGNVKIGNNVKIGANAVVLNDVEDNSIVVGIPAKPIRNR